MRANEQTVAAVIKTLCVLVVNVAALWGVDLDGDMVQNLACCAAMLAATGFGCWTNMNFTAASQMGQRVVNLIKDGADVTIVENVPKD